MEEKSIKKGRKISQILFHAIAFLFLFGFTAYLFKPFLQAGFPSGSDTIGHCFKVKYIADMLVKYGRFVDWWEPWYCGHHLLLFYPPLSYLGPVILQIFLKDPAIVGKISVSLGVFLAALNMYFLVLVLLEEKKPAFFRTIAAVGGAVAYASSPILIHLYAEWGAFSDFYAMVFAPLCFIPLIKWLRTGKNSLLVIYAFVLGLVFFLHGHIATMVGFGSFLFVLIYLMFVKRTKPQSPLGSVSRGIFLLVLSLLLFVGLTAVWWIPYFAQVQKIGRGVIIDPSHPAISLPLSYFFRRGIINDVGVVYVGFFVFFLSVSSLFFRKYRAEVVGFWGVFLLGLIICLGFNTPIYPRLPIINMIWPERGMVLFVLSLACLVGISIFEMMNGLSKMGACKGVLRFVALILGVALISLIIWDFSYAFTRISVFVIPEEHKDFCKYLSEQPKEYGDRVAMVANRGTAFSSVPFMTGFNDVDGYLIESSKNSWFAYMVTSRAVEKNESSFFLRKYDIFNVNYLVVDKIKKLEPRNLLATGKFKEVYENDRYLILKYLEKKGFVQSLASPTLIIGEKPDYLIDILSINNDMGFVEGREKLDDYSLEDLRSFNSVILYDFKVLNLPVVEEVLEGYVESGGTLVIDTDGTGFKNGGILSVKSVERDFSGPVETESFEGELNFTFSPATYEGGSWRGVYYDGLDEDWLTIDGKYPVAGVKRIGEGKAVFLGFNIFFHAAYYDNPGEKIYLRELIRPLLDDGGGNLSYEVVSVKPGEKKIEVDVSEPTWVLVSMSWSPYWHAFVDGKEQRIYPCENLISLKLPKGVHELKFKYMTTKIHYLANGISLFTLVLAILFIGKARKKRKIAERIENIDAY